MNKVTLFIYSCYVNQHELALFQAIIKAASNSNPQIDKHSSQIKMSNANDPRIDHLNQKKISLKTRKDGHWVNEEIEERYNHRVMDDTNQYSSHLEHSKRITGLSGPSNMVENDSENNYDDASSCASDSAIGKVLYFHLERHIHHFLIFDISQKK